MASTLVIYNPIAGRMRVRALWPQVEQALKQAGVDFEAVPTQAPREAIELARAAAGRYATVVAVGGDGTISEVANGLMLASHEDQTLPLGVVPLGNGDDFAKVLSPQAPIGGKSYGWRTAIEKIARGNSQLVDVGRITPAQSAARREVSHRYFVNIVDIGFGAHTVQNFATVPSFISGYPAYLVAVLKTMFDYPALRIRIKLDDEPEFEQITTMTAVGNGRCFGGGFWVCPEALPDDGVFDVMVTRQITRRTILRLIPRLQRGTHVGDAAIRISRARRVVLDADEAFLVDADGELPFAPTRRLTIDLLPSKLRLIV